MDFAADSNAQDYQNSILVQETPNKYGHVYEPCYTNGVIADLYQYQAQQRYLDETLQNKIDDKGFYSRSAGGVYNGFGSPNDVISPKLTHLDSVDPRANLSPFDYRASSQCSRSSSRDTTFGTNQMYPCPYSNRSESSASDVDVVSEEIEKQRNHGDFLLDHGQNSKDESFKSSGKTPDNEKSHSPVRSSAHQSVIMRPTPRGSSVQSDVMNKNSEKTTSKSPSCARSGDTPSAMKIAETSAEIDNDFFPSNDKLLDMRLHEKAFATNDIYAQCLRAACAYDSYNQSNINQTVPISNQRQYPVMPQAGYTSVIVDAQQYHLSNGYVH